MQQQQQQQMKSAKNKKIKSKEKVGIRKEDTAEGVCFVCKDGGELRICDFKECVKAYHPECVKKEDSFLDDDDFWKCAWHSCMHCGKSPKFHCFCCPKAVCGRCLCDVDFAVVTDTKGFCEHCLTLSGLIERTKIPAPAQEVDFDAEDSYEYLFKHYWEWEIKEAEGLTAEHLLSAVKRLKREILDQDIDLDPIYDAKGDSSGSSGSCWNELDCADVNSGKQRNKARHRGKVTERKHSVKMKGFMSKKKEFSGWGSKVLVDFLASIGKDTSQQLSQQEVAEIIKRYAAENNLFDPEKKKKILCDAKLSMLFGRKSVNKNRILGHLPKHFAENQSDDDLDLAEDDWFVVDDEDNVEVTYKRQRFSTSIADCQDKVAVPIVKKSCFASVTTSNIKLVYLKRKVVEELSKDSENFDAKVIGSFVRVKANPYDYTQKNSHLLVEVRGVQRQIGEKEDTILLQVSDMMGEIPICKLTDENFTEEECQDLHQRVKNGLLKRPVVLELEEKARVLHEAITKDWIERELIILNRLIAQARVKGWRREYAEYWERLGKLKMPEEQSRLFQEIPEVVPDEEEVEAASEEIRNDEQEVVRGPEIALRFSRGSRIYWCPVDQADVGGDEVDENCPSGPTRCAWADKESKSQEEKSKSTKTDHKEGDEGGDHCSPGLVDESFWSDKEGKSRENNKSINTKTDCGAELQQQSREVACKRRNDGMLQILNQEATKKDELHLEPMNENNVCKELLSSRVEIIHSREADDAVSPSNHGQGGSAVQANKHHDQGTKQQPQCAAAAAHVILIELSDDDDDDDLENDGKQHSGNLPVSNKQKIDVNARIWNCMNPRGIQLEGPYSMLMLKEWKDTSTGPFVAEFRVWREGQSREEAVLLDEAISQAYGPSL